MRHREQGSSLRMLQFAHRAHLSPAFSHGAVVLTRLVPTATKDAASCL
jgi:hypothetical protein